MKSRCRFRTLNAYVNQRRRAKRWTQGQVAKAMGMSEAALSKHLRGEPMGRKRALDISRRYGIDISSLLSPPARRTPEAA